ncbi:polymer-forming cytoskeletal protein [Paenibacillus alginolyticus]|uniref:Polymer-forming cytoskeletal protein n=1 Tax=Paenibacillus alginolyticus TaxID=59839 RepID=A0ABT4G9F9_9BACL|nr:MULTISPECIES: polymer-forming cytoskeletal protein [Paenibacillus]MCY9667142.1 polymer-forming cytoskeletal protein [Paenibacillus alginolyticus]MCY9692821.1 polymer-forming cytoskeletal protein [Paenibacillus alginolyticus]MEC0148416.1 polymer-forming cytoskeletal protein [Paenibacillus alginolyticus]NRF91066.1 polymer-forming cytoskeletal protein [Paenibacillus frigoriresistens]
MFKKKKDFMNPNTTDTLIGEGTTFEGRIKSAASIRIEGGITGDIECAGDVIIGENGVVKSNISARDVVLAGNVQGNIITKGKLTITSTGSLQGNISAASFVIEEGGQFQGNSKMDSKTSTSAPIQNGEQENGNKPASSANGAFKGNTVAM